MPPSAMIGDTVLLCSAGSVINGGDLRNADACNHTGGADGAGTDANLYAVSASLDQCLGAIVGGHVAGDELRPWGTAFLILCTHSRMFLDVTVGAVQCQHVGAWPPPVRPHAPARQPLRRWLRRRADDRDSSRAELGYCIRLLNVLNGDETLEAKVLSSTMGSFSILCCRRISLASSRVVPYRGGDQVLMGHHLRDGTAQVRFKTACRGW